MSINTSVYLVQNSGWDIENVPDSQALAESTGTNIIQLSGVVMRQSGRDSIRVEIDDMTAREVDYLFLRKDGKTYYYFVIGYNMVAQRTCELYLELDGLTTINALANGLGVITGWMTRRNKTNGEMNNISLASKLKLSEPFTPSEEVVEDYDNSIVGAKKSGSTSLVHSVTNLTELGKKATKYIADDGSYVTVPNLSRLTEETIFNIISSDSDLDAAWSTVGMGIYRTDDSQVAEGIMKNWALGVDSIKKSYILPLAYGYAPKDADGFVEMVTSTETVYTANIPVLPDGYVPENYKAALLHQKIKLISTVSGETAEFSASQIADSIVDGKYDFVCWANPGPEGAPYCRPTVIKGNKSRMFGAVRGSNWQNAPFANTGQEGWAQTKKETFNDGKFGEIIGDLVGITAGVAAVAGGTIVGGPIGGLAAGAAVAGLESQAMGMDNKYKAREAKFTAANLLKSPEIAFAPSGDMQNFIGNDFSVIRERLDVDDIIRFDEFLHKYGESVSETFTTDKCFTRSNYNFIQVERVVLKGDFPRWVSDAAVAQLNGGVRIWHTRPNIAALQIGGN